MAKSAQNLDMNRFFQSVSSLVLRPLQIYSWAYGNEHFHMYLPQSAEVMYKNAILSNDSARQTQYFERILHFQTQMCSNRCEIYMQ